MLLLAMRALDAQRTRYTVPPPRPPAPSFERHSFLLYIGHQLTLITYSAPRRSTSQLDLWILTERPGLRMLTAELALISWLLQSADTQKLVHACSLSLSHEKRVDVYICRMPIWDYMDYYTCVVCGQLLCPELGLWV
jgi:hypothetical protein